MADKIEDYRIATKSVHHSMLYEYDQMCKLGTFLQFRSNTHTYVAMYSYIAKLGALYNSDFSMIASLSLEAEILQKH